MLIGMAGILLTCLVRGVPRRRQEPALAHRFRQHCGQFWMSLATGRGVVAVKHSVTSSVASAPASATTAGDRPTSVEVAVQADVAIKVSGVNSSPASAAPSRLLMGMA
ncbi:hypothetical protein WL39_21250 [Burkholderia ubonensis]|nr:hypothetical protein WI81_10270 [Burkholderia ubonensis]KWB60735.1 hypothetical protein WL39_21250 [Burkholderia ubonensis]KWB64423.1 hypothetical protein WL38_18115 [Burkholderia ubonensis]